MPNDLIRYDLLVQDALRSVVRKVLGDAARQRACPASIISTSRSRRRRPASSFRAALRQRYPDEMSIILQHEFWDLAVTPETFEVSVNFSRRPERLVVPFDAITGFNDPSVPFGFKLEPRQTGASEAARPAPEKPAAPLSPAVQARPDARPSEKPKPALRPAPRVAETPAAESGQVEAGRGQGARAEERREDRGEGRLDRRLPQEMTGLVGMAEIVNLRRARKQKAREEAEAAAKANRIAHGESKAARRARESERNKSERHVEGHRLDRRERRIGRRRWSAAAPAPSSARSPSPAIAPALRWKTPSGPNSSGSRPPQANR